MNATEYQTVTDFESALQVGQSVTVRWTNNNRSYKSPATVARVNKQSVIVTLDGEVKSDLGTYPMGHSIKAPLLTYGSGGDLWSANNRVEPVEGYK